MVRKKARPADAKSGQARVVKLPTREQIDFAFDTLRNELDDAAGLVRAAIYSGSWEKAREALKWAEDSYGNYMLVRDEYFRTGRHIAAKQREIDLELLR